MRGEPAYTIHRNLFQIADDLHNNGCNQAAVLAGRAWLLMLAVNDMLDENEPPEPAQHNTQIALHGSNSDVFIAMYG